MSLSLCCDTIKLTTTFRENCSAKKIHFYLRSIYYSKSYYLIMSQPYFTTYFYILQPLFNTNRLHFFSGQSIISLLLCMERKKNAFLTVQMSKLREEIWRAREIVSRRSEMSRLRYGSYPRLFGGDVFLYGQAKQKMLGKLQNV